MLHSLRFGSISELLRYLDRTPVCPTNFYSGVPKPGYGYNGHELSGEWWDFGLGLRGSQTMALKGWTDGAKRISAQSAPIVHKIASRMMRPEPAFDIDGLAIDMARYLQGEPECFLQWRDSEVEDANRPGKIVHIVANLSASVAFTATEFLDKGLAVAILVDCLESSGRRVILDVGAAGISKTDDTVLETIVRIKEADEPLTLESLAYSVAHPAFYRRLLFWARATIPVDFPETGLPHDLSIKGDINIGASKLWETDGPREWAIGELKRQGVEFRE